MRFLVCWLVLCFTAALYSDADRVQVLSAEAFKQDVLGGDRLWVVEFFAPWCGGCKMASPWYKEAAALMELPEEHAIPFAAMNMDTDGISELGGTYGVSGMPHLMAFLPGQPEPVGMAGLGGMDSIANFARAQWKALTPAQQAAHAAEAEKRNAPYSIEDPDPEVHKAMGIKLEQAGQNSAAVLSFRAAVRFAPNSSKHHFNLGTALLDLAGTPGEAVAVLKKALQLDPNNADAEELLQEAQGAKEL